MNAFQWYYRCLSHSLFVAVSRWTVLHRWTATWWLLWLWSTPSTENVISQLSDTTIIRLFCSRFLTCMLPHPRCNCEIVIFFLNAASVWLGGQVQFARRWFEITLNCFPSHSLCSCSNFWVLLSMLYYSSNCFIEFVLIYLCLTLLCIFCLWCSGSHILRSAHQCAGALWLR